MLFRVCCVHQTKELKLTYMHPVIIY